MGIEHRVRIGLEIHIPITSVETKLFCNCKNTSRYKPSRPNEFICPICLGLPGALPHPNEKAIYYAIKAAKALNSKINKIIQFYRKHYFYPDLPKGYQITQYKAGGYAPLGEGGFLKLKNGRIIKIRRIQIEEDPAKLIHPSGLGESDKVLIDYNRSGNPLIEVVTEPDLNTPREAREFLEKLIRLFIDIGVLDREIDIVIRADANISLGGSARIEIKNIGSPKDVEKALEFEEMRLRRYIQEGVKTIQETRHWDDRRRITVSIREKEAEEEYRYFPDPNIPPIDISYLIEDIEGEKIILEEDMYMRLISLGISSYYAEIISKDRELYNIFMNILDKLKINDTKLADRLANLCVNEGKRLINKGILSYDKLEELLSSILSMMKEGLLTFKEAREKLMMKLSGEKLKIVDEDTLRKKVLDILNKAEKRERRFIDYIIGRVIEDLKKEGYKLDIKMLTDIVTEYVSTGKKEIRKERVIEKPPRPIPYTESLAKRKINISDAFIVRKGKYTLTGWIESKMIIGDIIFIILRDWSGSIQLVINKDSPAYNIIKRLPRETFISAEGELIEDRRAPGGVELHVYNISQLSEAYKPPLTLIDISRSSMPVRMKYRYLDIRRRYMKNILRFRSKLLNILREYFADNGFIEINTPKIIITATEGGAELFPIIFYGKEAFLAQSPQLYKQMAINAFEKVFEIDSYYRAQKYDTPRHLAEFWSIDVEVALYKLDDILELIEDILTYITRRLDDYAKDELAFLNKMIMKIDKPFKRITYSDALNIINEEGVKIKFGDDLGAEHLSILGRKFKKPFFITHWPRKTRAFYYKIDPDDDRLTLSFDLMYPMENSYPLELSSGGERINTIDELRVRIKEKGLREEAYTWYLEMFKYGMPPHAGFGLGLDRLVMALLQLDTVLDTVLSPRSPKYDRP